VLRHRGVIFALLIVVSLVAVPLAVQIRFDFNFQEYFPEDDPVREDYRRLVADFPAEESEFIVLVGDDDIFSPAGTQALVELTRDLETAGWFSQVTGPVTLPPSVFGTFRNNYRDIVAGVPQSKGDYAELRERMASHPLLRNHLIGDDGNLVVLRAAMNPEHVTDLGREGARRYLAELLPQYETKFTEVVYTGFSGVRADFARVMQREQQVLFPAVVVALLLVLVFFLGRTWLVLIPLLATCAALTWTLAVMVLRDAPFTILSTGMPVLLVILGISDSLHIFYRYRQAICDKRPQHDTVLETFSELGRACFFTSLTTAVGFIARFAFERRGLATAGAAEAALHATAAPMVASAAALLAGLAVLTYSEFLGLAYLGLLLGLGILAALLTDLLLLPVALKRWVPSTLDIRDATPVAKLRP